MRTNKKRTRIATTNKEYNIGRDKYEMWAVTCWIDRKPFRSWKLYRKNQYKTQ